MRGAVKAVREAFARKQDKLAHYASMFTVLGHEVSDDYPRGASALAALLQHLLADFAHVRELMPVLY